MLQEKLLNIQKWFRRTCKGKVLSKRMAAITYDQHSIFKNMHIYRGNRLSSIICGRDGLPSDKAEEIIAKAINERNGKNILTTILVGDKSMNKEYGTVRHKIP